MAIQEYAYLLNGENKIYENKIFIDLMWYIAKNKDNGEGKPKGMVTVDKNGKSVVNAKSYVIRNAGIMFQHIFDWHLYYITEGKPTQYRYNNKGTMVNVVYKNFEDWWNAVRLTETEITSANKFLVETGLISIHVMPIMFVENKGTDKETRRPRRTNCYSINWEVAEQYLKMLVDVSKEIYNLKVAKVREKNIKTSQDARIKKVSTEEDVTLETQVTLKIEASHGTQSDLPTLSTLSTSNNIPKSCEQACVTCVTPVPKDTLVTDVPKDTRESHVPNNTLSTLTLYSHPRLEREKSSPLSVEKIWEGIQEDLSRELEDASFKTWIKTLVAQSFNGETLTVVAPNDFTRGIVETRYTDAIKTTSTAEQKGVKHVKVIEVA